MGYWIFLAITALELGYEVRVSRRNSAELLRRGAVDVAPAILPLMTTLYAAMYAGAALEFHLRGGILSPLTFAAFLALYVAGKGLKFWAVTSLGGYWTMKVLVVPGSKVVTRGPYRYVRHPNYIAVLMEIAGTTLAGNAWITCAVILALFSIVLYYRIRSEEQALAGHTDYTEAMAAKRRFLP